MTKENNGILVHAPVIQRYTFSRPLQGDEAREVYKEVRARVAKDFKNASAFNQYFEFDEDTQGFATYNRGAWPKFSMAIATGYGKVALIQTGRSTLVSPSTTDWDPFNATDDFTAANATAGASAKTLVWNFNGTDTVLPSLGPITTAEMSRIPGVNATAQLEGWVFVGGMGGVAFLP